MTSILLRKGTARLGPMAHLLQMLKTLADDCEWEVSIKPHKSRRSVIQNDRMWAQLTDISRQVPWSVNGIMQNLTPEEWKDLLSASLTSEMRVANGINGGIVLLGRRTSKMTIREMADLIDLMTAFGAEHGVRFTAGGEG